MTDIAATRVWLPYRTPRPAAAARVFCVPHAGAGASVLADWTRWLPPEIDWCAVQLPGRETRFAEPPCRDAGRLLDQLVGALAPLLDVRCALFGHSLGAGVAFELARRLGARGHPPAALFLSGLLPPCRRARRDLHTKSDPELLSWLATLDPRPSVLATEPELRELIFPVLRADLQLLQDLPREGPPVPCPLHIFGGTEDPTTTTNDLLAWRHETTQTCRLTLYPGHHHFVATHAASISRLIADELLPDRSPSPAPLPPNEATSPEPAAGV